MHKLKSIWIAYDLLISHDVIGQSSKSQVGWQWNMVNDAWRRSRETGNIHNWGYIFVLNDAVRFVTTPFNIFSPAMLHYYLNCWRYTLPCWIRLILLYMCRSNMLPLYGLLVNWRKMICIIFLLQRRWYAQTCDVINSVDWCCSVIDFFDKICAIIFDSVLVPQL